MSLRKKLLGLVLAGTMVLGGSAISFANDCEIKKEIPSIQFEVTGIISFLGHYTVDYKDYDSYALKLDFKGITIDSGIMEMGKSDKPLVLDEDGIVEVSLYKDGALVEVLDMEIANVEK